MTLFANPKRDGQCSANIVSGAIPSGLCVLQKRGQNGPFPPYLQNGAAVPAHDTEKDLSRSNTQESSPPHGVKGVCRNLYQCPKRDDRGSRPNLRVAKRLAFRKMRYLPLDASALAVHTPAHVRKKAE